MFERFKHLQDAQDYARQNESMVLTHSKQAFFSLNNFCDVAEFARKLINMGWNIIATTETVKELSKRSIQVSDISSFINFNGEFDFPPTLHPQMEAALTTNSPSRIDLVYVNPYPLSEGNDVGGHTILGLAAKGNRIAVSSREDMEKVLADLENHKEHYGITENLHDELIHKSYASIVEHYLSLLRSTGKNMYDGIIARSALELANGENPYQIPAHFMTFKSDDRLSLKQFNLRSDNVPCFVNLADLDNIQRVLCFTVEAFRLNCGRVPYISIAAKHGNPCGMAVDWSDPVVSIKKALFGDPVAIWGGEFITNFEIDRSCAEALNKDAAREKNLGDAHWMLDVIAAADYTKEAIAILHKRKSRKIWKNPALCEPTIEKSSWHYRHVRGGFLRQPHYHYVLNLSDIQRSNTSFGNQTLESLILAWAVVWCSNHGGNEVALAKDGMLVGVGGGPATVEAARIAVSRAHRGQHDTKGAVFAADAFFPFTDAPKMIKDAGCRGGVVPDGGKNKEMVKRYFRANDMNVIYIPSLYRGFCRH